MDKSGFPRFHKQSAPYVSNVGNLICHPYSNFRSVYYRTGGFGGVAKKEIFAAGNFQVAEKSWSSSNGKLSAMPAHTGSSAMAGYFSYESGFAFEERWRNLPTPVGGYVYRFFQIPCWYEVDHENRTGTIISSEESSPAEREILQEIILNHMLPAQSRCPGTIQPGALEALGELTKEDYVARINRVLEDIRAGRYYELNFTQRFQYDSRKNPHALFVELLKNLTAERAFFADFGDEVICSCSPELFLQKRGDKIWTAPIKGSYAQTPDPKALEKLNAEHTMVVDLARNDFGRVSDQEWVSVEDFNRSRSFGGLSHIESLIVGKTSRNWINILPSLLPAASITGAPKVEVVQAISEYEKSPRGLYTGNCGWVWPGGDVDLNVAIRTFRVLKGDDQWRYELGAGGAIVADSIPGEEYRECIKKAQPLFTQLLDCE